MEGMSAHESCLSRDLCGSGFTTILTMGPKKARGVDSSLFLEHFINLLSSSVRRSGEKSQCGRR